MIWNASLIDGPVSIPIFGPPMLNEEGREAPNVIGYVAGYHLNVAPEVAEGLEAYEAVPRNPRRVFAGADTVFLRFADEAEARAALGAYWIEPGPD